MSAFYPEQMLLKRGDLYISSEYVDEKKAGYSNLWGGATSRFHMLRSTPSAMGTAPTRLMAGLSPLVDRHAAGKHNHP
jgi:hypothetical protein